MNEVVETVIRVESHKSTNAELAKKLSEKLGEAFTPRRISKLRSKGELDELLTRVFQDA
jgi:hypothetical protein